MKRDEVPSWLPCLRASDPPFAAGALFVFSARSHSNIPSPQMISSYILC